jgi:heme oxygenase (biliverdin-producing, ferredoxin)
MPSVIEQCHIDSSFSVLFLEFERNDMATSTLTTNDCDRKVGCPYAVAIEDDEQSQQSVDLLNQAKKSCPAFKDECPFSHAKSPEDLRQALSKVPPSHYKETYFKKALVHLHTIGPNVDKPEFQLKECPVASYISAHSSPTFAKAMEELSLAGIMSRMIRDMGDQEEEEEEGIDDFVSKIGDETDVTTLQSGEGSNENSGKLLLSLAFKTGTSVAHKAAEDVHFVKNFVKGKIDRNLYADMILGLAFVYSKLEDLLDAHAPNTFPSCHFPFELNRRNALKEDLEFWYGCDIPKLAMSPATRDYLDHLDCIAERKPLLLLSHAYTRYLGDLSGGKVLARVARRALNLDKDNGLAFYNFENVVSAKLFKDKYREALDRLKVSANDIQDLVHEANIAFLLNMRLFEELDVKANVPGSQVRCLKETLSWIDEIKPSSPTSSKEECPFLVKKNESKPLNGDKAHGRCPWPFVFFHDPIQGFRDYQTWIVFGLALAWMWSYLQHNLV